MNCQNHPDKEAVANCAVCGKPVCRECLIEIAGNTYCKDCVSELVTASIVEKAMKDKAPATEEETINETIPEPETIKESVSEPVKDIEDEAAEDGDYDFENQFEEEEPEPVTEVQSGGHKFRSAASVSSILEEEGIGQESASYAAETPSMVKEPVIETPEEEPVKVEAPEPVYSEADYYKNVTPNEDEESFDNNDEGPDEELEAKYEKYLEDLYYDEPEKTEQPVIEETRSNEPLSLQDQLAQDEARNGPLTNKPFEPESYESEELSSGMSNNYSNETYTSSLTEEEDEDVIVPVHMQNANNEGGMSYDEIRERLLQEEGFIDDGEGEVSTNRVQTAYVNQQADYEKEMNNTGVASRFHRGSDVGESIYAPEEPQYYADESDYYYDYPEKDLSGVRTIHQSHKSSRREEDEKFSVGEIILTIILIVLILIVIAYVIYLFTLSGDYPTFIDAVTVLFTDPSQLISNIFG